MTENPLSLPIPDGFWERRKEYEKFLSKKGITKQGFHDTVAQKMDENNLSFIKATYETFDEFFQKEAEASDITLACKKGCSQCCHTLVTATEEEVDEIVRYVNFMPWSNKRALVKKIATISKEWVDYYKKNQFRIKRSPLAYIKDYDKKPCVFLGEDGACEVYPVRPVNCRGFSSLRPCSFPEETEYFGDVHNEGPTQHRFLCETWATNSICEHVAEKMGVDPGQAPVSPIIDLLYLNKKELGF